MRVLLDANVLIALATPEHSINARAAEWFVEGHRFATYPITQGALYRFHLRAGVGATAESARLLLQSISALPRHEFWPDDASYLEMPTTCQRRLKTTAFLPTMTTFKRARSAGTRYPLYISL